jgi:hypothetical protein
MVAQLNHTIVAARDKLESATFLSEILGLPAPEPFGHFLVVATGNGVSLDYAETGDEIAGQHYAFLITEEEFDEVFARVQERGITYWPNPWPGTKARSITTTAGAVLLQRPERPLPRSADPPVRQRGMN